ncbi:YkvA family protein [Virgibacillus sp. W0430]|uniref:YkvA family protein n=1 Tax=Virgibacillus sp. W0430 TaxID=3391580 RepID=UPI003F471061
MNRLFHRFAFLAKFHKSLPFLKDFFFANEVSIGKKAFFAVTIVGYIVFPFDLIPDFILGFGIIDDLAIAAFLLQQLVKLAPHSLKEKHQLHL